MAEKGVSFYSKQTRIREFYPVSILKGKAFADVAEELYGRLLKEGKTIRQLADKRGNIINQERRTGLIKFFYWADNQEIPISKSELVIDFYLNTGVNEVLFFVDVIGGASIPTRSRSKLEFSQLAEEYSHYQFLAHAKEILSEPTKHGTWILKEFAPNKFRLVKTLHDRCRRSITLVLQANTGYPRRPPHVLTVPRHRDPCFSSNGELNWTVVKETNTFTWELYLGHANPLIYLLDELKTKYGLVF